MSAKGPMMTTDMIADRTLPKPSIASPAARVLLCATVAVMVLLITQTPPHAAAVSVAQSGAPALRLTAEIDGLPTAAAADGDYVYVAAHSRIVVLDPTAAPSAPPVAVSAPLGDRIHSLDVVDGIAVTTGSFLHVLDVSDPRAIIERGRLPLQTVGGSPTIIVGDQAWIHRRLAGIHRVDISNPSQPRSLGYWRPVASGAEGVSTRLASIARLGQDRVAVWLEPADRSTGDEPSTLLIASILPGGAMSVDGEWLLECCVSGITATSEHLAVRRRTAKRVEIYHAARGEALTSVRTWRLRNKPVSAIIAGGEALWILSDTDTIYYLPIATDDRILGPFTRNLDHRSDWIRAATEDRLLTAGEWLNWIDAFGHASAGPDLHPRYWNEIEAAPSGLWTMGLDQDRVDIEVGRVFRDSEASPWRLLDSGLSPPPSSGFSRATGSRIRSISDRLHVAGAFELQDAIALPNGRAELEHQYPANPDGLRYTGAHAVSAQPERFLYRLDAVSSHMEHFMFVRSTAPDSLGDTFDFAFGPSTSAFTGAAVVGDIVWTMTLSGSGPQLTPWRLTGPDAGQMAAAPQFIGLQSTSLIGAHGSLLWLARGNLLILVESANPSRLVELTTIDFPSTVGVVAQKGDLLWATTATAGRPGTSTVGGGGITVFDVRDPRAPIELAHEALGITPSDLVAEEDAVWVAAGALQRYEIDRDAVEAPTRASPATATSVTEPPPGGTATPPTRTPTPNPTVVGGGSPELFLPWLSVAGGP